MSIRKKPFGTLHDGSPIELYTIENGTGANIVVSTLGAGLVEINMPDRNGTLGDCILGFDRPEAYCDPDLGFQGLVVGRVANRIAGASFALDGKTYHLPENNGGDYCLHSNGQLSFHPWSVIRTTEDSITLTRTSKDGEDGYPGNFSATVCYTFTPENTIRIEYEAVSDQKTLVNLTNHAYFNLACDGGTIDDHILTLDADEYTACDENIIPTGKLEPVKGTPLDFTKAKRVGDDLNGTHPLNVSVGGGYDHNFCLRNRDGSRLSRAAVLEDPQSGRVMEVYTTMPGVQLYTANFLTDGTPAKNHPLRRHGALCLETQLYPDAIHHPEFPNSVLEAGETFLSRTEFRFRVK